MSETGNVALLDGLLTPAAAGVPWLEALRGDARRAFDAEGLPGRRTESWKYTRLSRLLDTAFLPDRSGGKPGRLPETAGDLDAWRVVLANGRFVHALSDLAGLPDGVTVAGLADVLENAPGTVEPWLGKALSHQGMPLAALNTFGFEDGLYVHVADGVLLDRPIHVVSYTDGSVRATSSSPRMVYVVGGGAAADIVETHCGAGDYLVNAAAEIFVGRGGRLGHYKRQDEGENGFHVSAASAVVSEGGLYDSFVLQTGAGLARNEIQTLLDGETAECRLNGAYAARADQHLDNTTFIDHAAPNCESREIYKGVLADTARGVFQGKILVRRGAQGTDGHQLNRALLLSRGAEIDSKPELEIYADDVKCSHGATAGELDETQLFYLRARGIGEQDARQILVEAFLMEVLDEIENEGVREAFAATLQHKLAAVAAATNEGAEA